MTKEELYFLKYPIGEFNAPTKLNSSMIEDYLNTIEQLPIKLELAVNNLSKVQLDTPYRPDGWTIRQVVHHIPDSHLNSYIRFKWTLTENNPTIKAYQEADWANLSDYDSTPIEISLSLLKALHQRWIILLRSLSPDDLSKTFIHPETSLVNRLDTTIAHYAWHSEHHLAHIVNLKKRMNWD